MDISWLVSATSRLKKGATDKMDGIDMGTPLIEIKHLKKYFRTQRGMLHAVDDISFSIPEGETLGVVGESGCGKSTLGRTLLRLLEPTDGEVLYKGENILECNKEQMRVMRTKMQMIFQDPYASLDPRMTVSNIIAEPIKVCRLLHSENEINEKVNGLMETVGLAPRFANAYPHELDGGRRQRIGIARALAVDPKFIVCDEPVSALDVSIQAQILNLLMDLQEQHNLTYMFITHDMSVVKHISNRIAVMYLGQCVEFSETEELFNNPMHPFINRRCLWVDHAVSFDSSTGKFLFRLLNIASISPKCRFIFCNDYSAYPPGKARYPAYGSPMICNRNALVRIS